jgi:hypothetical protein
VFDLKDMLERDKNRYRYIFVSQSLQDPNLAQNVLAIGDAAKNVGDALNGEFSVFALLNRFTCML